jgi:tetratricopeptide (TPR) repeat protein
MAPEQHIGGTASAAADQFSFCVAMWEALFGTRPFVAGSVRGFLAAVRRAEPEIEKRPKALPRAMEAILGRGLALHPDRRWPSMQVLLDRLQRATAPRRPPVFAIMAAVVGVGALVWLGRGDVEDRCEDARMRAQAVWNDGRRADVEAAFGNVGRASAVPHVVGMLDSYIDGWNDRFADVCSSASRSDAALDCLDAKLAAVGATVDLLRSGAPAAVERAPEVVFRLPDLGHCTPARAGSPPPGAVDLWQTIARADALLHAGEFEASASIAAAAGQQAIALGYMPLVAEAGLVEGRAHAQRFEVDRALSTLEAAYLLAVDAGDDRVAMDAALAMFHELARTRGEHEPALRWWRHAEAAAQRRGLPHMPPADALQYGVMLRELGREHEAKAVFEDARIRARRRIAELEPTGMGAERVELLSALGNLGARLRDYEAAVADMTEALGVVAALFGDDSYTHAAVSHDLGAILLARGDYADAEVHLGHAREVLARVAPGQPMANVVEVRMGWCLANLGRFDEAITTLERVHALETEMFDESHHDVLYAAFTLTDVYLLAERMDDAERILEHMLVVVRAARGADSSEAGDTLVRLGMLAERRNDSDAAEQRYREALAVLRPNPNAPPSVLEALALLAQLVVQNGSQHEAVALVDEMFEVARGRFGEDATGTLRIELIAVRVYNDAGRGADALERAARVHELLERRAVDPLIVARAEFEHARALDAAGVDRERALALARHAEKAFVAGTGATDDRERVVQWLAR